MFLSELVGKKIYSAGKIRGICRGVGLTVKSRAVKYLICVDIASERELFLSLNAIAEISENGIRLKAFRPTAPQSISRLFSSRPVYDETGEYLGIVVDLEIENGVATALITDTGSVYSAYSLTAVSDAVLLKRRLSFPLGEKTPAFFKRQTGVPVLSKALLKHAIEKGELIRLTLALPLFSERNR